MLRSPAARCGLFHAMWLALCLAVGAWPAAQAQDQPMSPAQIKTQRAEERARDERAARERAAMQLRVAEERMREADRARALAETAANAAQVRAAAAEADLALARLQAMLPRLDGLDADAVKRLQRRDAEQVGLPAAVFQAPGRDGAQGPVMVLVPGANASVGAAGPEAAASDTGARVLVTAKRFALGMREVTRGEYSAFVRVTGHSPATDCSGPVGEAAQAGLGWQTPGFAQADDHPVVCVSWDDAQAYLAWLRKASGLNYRLPSETEWELAARAGVMAGSPWESAPDRACGYANLADSSASGTATGARVECRDGAAYTATVGRLRPNALGLQDMLGNVREWTQDCWQADLQNRPPLAAPRERACSDPGQRVHRGGSWNSGHDEARFDARAPGPAAARRTDLGFRLALSWAESVQQPVVAVDLAALLPIEHAECKPGASAYYTVKPGDTMIRIGLDNGQNWRDVLRWSGLENPNLIEVGQVLRVCPP